MASFFAADSLDQRLPLLTQWGQINQLASIIYRQFRLGHEKEVAQLLSKYGLGGLEIPPPATRLSATELLQFRDRQMQFMTQPIEGLGEKKMAFAQELAAIEPGCQMIRVGSGNEELQAVEQKIEELLR